MPSGGDQTNHWSLLATSPPANPPTTTSGRGHAPEKLVINAKKIVEIAFEIYWSSSLKAGTCDPDQADDEVPCANCRLQVEKSPLNIQPDINLEN